MTFSGFIAVGIGAALGAWLRWALAVTMNALLPNLPLGTLCANVVGGFLIGVAVEVLGRQQGWPVEVRLFLVTGFLGGLTTFSTFSAEVVDLLARALYGWAALLLSLHLAGSIAATFAGLLLARAMSGQ